MAKGNYIGEEDIARKIKKAYIGVNGVARKVKKAYIGVNNVAREIKFGKINNTLTLSATSGSTTYGINKTFTVSNNASGGALSVTSSNTNIATVSISGMTVTIVPKKVGSATITVTSAATEGYNSASATYGITINKGTSTITLSSTSGTTTAGKNLTITATTNFGGTLSVSSSKTAVASASVSGNTVTIVPVYINACKGTATITVSVAETENYTAASATYNVTVQMTEIKLLGRECKCGQSPCYGHLVIEGKTIMTQPSTTYVYSPVGATIQFRAYRTDKDSTGYWGVVNLSGSTVASASKNAWATYNYTAPSSGQPSLNAGCSAYGARLTIAVNSSNTGSTI